MIAGRAALRPRLVAAGETLAAGEARVGGKALGLARLATAGARVPEWLVVAVEAFATALEAAGLSERCERALAELSAIDAADPGRRRRIEETASALQAEVGALALPPSLLRELDAALTRLGPGPFAVRSSMVGEDSATRSFAGQLDSFLHQPAGDVAGAIVRCWQSAFGARALAYQLAGGAVVALPRIAVVVQRMVDGRVSGVLFTSNPVSGDCEESLVSATFGLGEGVVGGACDADEFVWSRTAGERTATIAKKERTIVRAAGGVGTEEVAVADARVEVRSVSPAELAAICEEGLRVAAALGAPQDIEWTLAEDGLYLLQARPITARALRAAPAAADGPRVVWDNSNIQESYCGVTTPLTFSFAADCYASVYRQTLVALGVPAATIAAYEPLLANLLGLVRGRVYYNINNWYRALQVLPSFGRNKHDMERMMGLDSPVDFVEDQRLSAGERLRRAPHLLRTAARLLAAFARLDGKVARFLADFDASMARFDRRGFAGAGLSQLLALRERARVELIGRWHTPILNDLYVMMACGRLGRLVERAVGGEVAPRLLSSLLAADDGVESVEPTRMLLGIARGLRETPAAVAVLRRGAPVAALVALRAAHPALGARIDEYLERYGDRCMGELKLETVSLRQDPSFVVQVLRNYVERADSIPRRWRRASARGGGWPRRRWPCASVRSRAGASGARWRGRARASARARPCACAARARSGCTAICTWPSARASTRPAVSTSRATCST